MVKRAPKAAKAREVIEQTIQRHLDAVELLMWELDTYDGDPDMEPTQGSVALWSTTDQRYWAAGNRDEREEVCEDEGAQDEREPDPGDAALLYHPNDQRLVVTGGFASEVFYSDSGVN